MKHILSMIAVLLLAPLAGVVLTATSWAASNAGQTLTQGEYERQVDQAIRKGIDQILADSGFPKWQLRPLAVAVLKAVRDGVAPPDLNQLILDGRNSYPVDPMEKPKDGADGNAPQDLLLELYLKPKYCKLLSPEAQGIYTNGWDTLRAARYERQKAMGLIDPAWKLSPRAADVKPWDSLSAAEKDRFDNIMAIYAACVWHMDKSIGDLVAALKQRNVLDNTLILFMSDNGGNAESGPYGKLNGANPGGPGSDVFCGESWANLENTPNRLYKHFNHEGGVSTPLIAHYPAGITAKGEFRTQPGHLVDIMATVADFGGATYPKTFKGKTIQPMEGRSLRPAFANQPIEREAIYWEHEGNAAVRVGDWKLVRRGRNGAWELYDLKADRTELNNLAAAQPERVQQLTALWNAWAKRANVVPSPHDQPKNKATQKKGNKKKAKQ